MSRHRSDIEGRLHAALSKDPWEHARDLWKNYGDPTGFSDCVLSGLSVPDDLRQTVANLIAGVQPSKVNPGHRGREEKLFMFRRKSLSRLIKKRLLLTPKEDWPLKDSEQTINDQVAAVVSVHMQDEVDALSLGGDERKKERISANTVKRDTSGR